MLAGVFIINEVIYNCPQTESLSVDPRLWNHKLLSWRRKLASRGNLVSTKHDLLSLERGENNERIPFPYWVW
jgi:hypothetical protein